MDRGTKRDQGRGCEKSFYSYLRSLSRDQAPSTKPGRPKLLSGNICAMKHPVLPEQDLGGQEQETGSSSPNILSRKDGTSSEELQETGSSGPTILSRKDELVKPRSSNLRTLKRRSATSSSSSTTPRSEEGNLRSSDLEIEDDEFAVLEAVGVEVTRSSGTKRPVRLSRKVGTSLEIEKPGSSRLSKAKQYLLRSASKTPPNCKQERKMPPRIKDGMNFPDFEIVDNSVLNPNSDAALLKAQEADQIAVSVVPGDTYQIYYVRDIADKRVLNGEIQYLIQWEGYDSSYDTWEPLCNLGCDHLVEKFEESLREKKKSEKSRIAMDFPVVQFRHGREPIDIVGLITRDGVSKFVVRFKDADYVQEISREECNKNIPQLVIKFYEDRRIGHVPKEVWETLVK